MRPQFTFSSPQARLTPELRRSATAQTFPSELREDCPRVAPREARTAIFFGERLPRARRNGNVAAKRSKDEADGAHQQPNLDQVPLADEVVLRGSTAGSIPCWTSDRLRNVAGDGIHVGVCLLQVTPGLSRPITRNEMKVVVDLPGLKANGTKSCDSRRSGCPAARRQRQYKFAVSSGWACR